MTLERSLVSAETAIHEEFGGFGAHLAADRLSRLRNGSSSITKVALDIIGTEIVGNVTAHNDFVRVVIRDSSIKGNVDFFAGSPIGGPSSISMTNTSIEGNLSSRSECHLRWPPDSGSVCAPPSPRQRSWLLSHRLREHCARPLPRGAAPMFSSSRRSCRGLKPLQSRLTAGSRPLRACWQALSRDLAVLCSAARIPTAPTTSC